MKFKASEYTYYLIAFGQVRGHNDICIDDYLKHPEDKNSGWLSERNAGAVTLGVCDGDNSKFVAPRSKDRVKEQLDLMQAGDVKPAEDQGRSTCSTCTGRYSCSQHKGYTPNNCALFILDVSESSAEKKEALAEIEELKKGLPFTGVEVVATVVGQFGADKGTPHVLYECDCHEEHCNYCAGGLSSCTVCHGAEGTLPTHCPEEPMDDKKQELILRRELDFVAGSWISLSSVGEPKIVPESDAIQEDNTDTDTDADTDTDGAEVHMGGD